MYSKVFLIYPPEQNPSLEPRTHLFDYEVYSVKQFSEEDCTTTKYGEQFALQLVVPLIILFSDGHFSMFHKGFIANI